MVLAAMQVNCPLAKRYIYGAARAAYFRNHIIPGWVVSTSSHCPRHQAVSTQVNHTRNEVRSRVLIVLLDSRIPSSIVHTVINQPATQPLSVDLQPRFPLYCKENKNNQNALLTKYKSNKTECLSSLLLPD